MADIALMPDGAPVRLASGAHSSPDEGVCVVELASLIAEEEFSDRPRCVCPVIGAFLRGWNDRAPHSERQRLSPYAARIVGSSAARRVTRERRDICLEWVGADLSHGVARRAMARIGVRLRIAVFCGVGVAMRPNEGAGDYAARVAVARGDATRTFELLDTLLATGEEQRRDHLVEATADNGHSGVNRNGMPAIAANGLPAADGNGASAKAANGNAGITKARNGNGDGSAVKPAGSGAAPAAGSGRFD
jgi:hypothetical protein